MKLIVVDYLESSRCFVPLVSIDDLVWQGDVIEVGASGET